MVLETNQGTAYRCFISKASYEYFSEQKDSLRCFCYMQFVNDQFFLYGFSETKERDFFKSLIQVSGIGPKGAIRILSLTTYTELGQLILNQDAKGISKLPGIGVKKAQKMIIEIKDKIFTEHFFEENHESSTLQQVYYDAVLALESLGFESSKIKQAIDLAKKEGGSWTTSALIKFALQILNKK